MVCILCLGTTTEQQTENEPGQRAAVEQLPAQRHGHIAAPGVDPCIEEKMSMFTILQTNMEKDCPIFCALCEWTRGLFSDIIKPETREVQQKLK